MNMEAIASRLEAIATNTFVRDGHEHEQLARASDAVTGQLEDQNGQKIVCEDGSNRSLPCNEQKTVTLVSSCCKTKYGKQRNNQLLRPLVFSPFMSIQHVPL